MSKKGAETNREDKTRVLSIIKLLEREHPDAKIALHYSNPLELLIATILSAQCTDERVNIVTTTLFKKYRDPKDYANADLNELEQEIKSTGFYHNKAKNIKKCCQLLIEKFDSKVPDTMQELLELPGVGRKTANVLLSNAYGSIEGIIVDTHVHRLAQRLGLAQSNNPDKIEQDLMKLVPKSQWLILSDLLIFHGRRVCIAKKPECLTCIIKKLCPSAFGCR